MANRSASTNTAFVVFRYVPKVEDAVDVIKMFFTRLSASSGPKWQIDILGPSLPSGRLLLTGVLEAIKRADLIIVVAGEVSHNVAFELGLAYALEKDLILLAPKRVVESIPKTFSDISGVKCAVYDPDRIMKLPDVLKAEMKAINADRTKRISKTVSPDYLVALGNILELEGLYADAIAKYQAASDLDPRNINYLARLGQTHANVYDLGKAEEVLRKALNVDPRCVQALDALSQVLLDAGKYQTAIDDCLKPLLVLFPRREVYYFKMAVALTELGRPEDAAVFLERSAKKERYLPRVFYDLAWTSARASKLFQAKKREECVLRSLRALTRAIKLDSTLAMRANTDQDFDEIRNRLNLPVKRRAKRPVKKMIGKRFNKRR